MLATEPLLPTGRAVRHKRAWWNVPPARETLLVVTNCCVFLVCLCGGIVYLEPPPLIWLLQRAHSRVLWYVDRPALRAAALSIDDAPHGNGSSTEAILDILQQHGATATFFIIAQQVETERHHALLRRMVREGHELGNHMAVDSKSVLLSDDDYRQQLLECDRLLRQHANTIRYHRPGGGFFTQRTLDLAAAHGYTTVLGSVYPHDPQLHSSALNSWYLRSHVTVGSIVILHDREHTPATLEQSLPWALRQRLRFVSISELKRRGK